ncbi:Ig-like domain-containing protein [Pyxidicoccus trucidator]|uniref:Ig-like domain-containing protein n=1 Tax=Pyxidicoccus trucidator TaxID=2709662 RepID=UPI0023DDB0DA|nr:Ig-like domain-containing protein [Pyxidicoccus trucidator]
MPRLPLLFSALLVLGWTSACIDVPDVVDPPEESSDSGSNLPPDAGGTPDAGPLPDAGSGGTDAGPVDSRRPTLLNTTPMGSATEVPRNAQLVLTFSEPMDIDSVDVGLQPSVTLGAPVWSQQDTVLTLQPVAELAENVAYAVSVDGEDVAGNSLTGTRSFSFTTTGPAPDTTAPTVLVASPSQTSTGNARNTLFEIVFSEPMNKASVQAAFSITAPSGFNGGGFSWNEAGTVMTYVLPASFAFGADVSWQVSTSAKDAAGNALTEALTRVFRIVRQGTTTLRFNPETSGGVGAPGYLRNNHLYNLVSLGDDGADNIYRLFIGFKLDSLPEELTQVSQATLRWWVTTQLGNPFEKHGRLLLEPVDVGDEIALTSDGPTPEIIADYDAEPLAPGVGVLASSVASPGSLDVTSWVAQDWSNRIVRNKRTQYRLRFEQAVTNDSIADVLRSDAEVHPTLAELQVVYEYP